MRCLRCQHDDSRVIDSRAHNVSIRRRRECCECGYRFTTYERVEKKLPLVLKKNGTREPFDRNKICDGLRLACRKRAISAEQLDIAVDTIEEAMTALAVDEIESAAIGALALQALLKLDMVAYVRFASVYQNIETPKDFLTLLTPWVEQNGA